MTPGVVAIIQARMGSSRLPGKVLLDIAGRPMLGRVYARTKRAAAVARTVVATTTDASDDPVAGYCTFAGIPFSRGSLYDVLDRCYQAARQAQATAVVRITADCPVIDPVLIDDVVGLVVSASVSGGGTHYDFAANRLPPPWRRTYPIGLDTEVCTFAALERAWKEAKEPQQREHVMPYLYEGVKLAAVSGRQSAVGGRLSVGESPRGFRIALLNHTSDFGAYRWTVDTAEDLEFIRQVFSRFDGRDDFSWKDVLELVRREPRLAEINAGIRHKTLEDLDERASHNS